MRPARRVVPGVIIVLTLVVGAGSLLLFAVFLLFGPPWPIDLVRPDRARLLWDALLCAVFFLQHSGMIRRGARERIARRVPAVYQPALYSIASGLALLALVLLWQPTDQFVFVLHGPARWVSGCVALAAIAGFAWGSRAFDAFDPFGVQPITASVRGTPVPASPFVARGPYRYVRHPLYLFMLVLIWSTPRFTTDQLLFNLLWTGWVVLATRLEERDLGREFGETYRQYQLSVPMLLPFPRLHRRACAGLPPRPPNRGHELGEDQHVPPGRGR